MQTTRRVGFVGREAELDLVADLIDALLRDRARGLLVVGEPPRMIRTRGR